jgi:hypothetical protein
MAARAVEDGIASSEEIDKAVRVGFGLRFAILGLIQLIDWGGNDIPYYAGNYLRQAFDSDRVEVHKISELYMKAGRNGLRERQGFYDYRNIDTDAYQRETPRKLVDLLDHLGLMAPPGGVTDGKGPAARADNPFLRSSVADPTTQKQLSPSGLTRGLQIRIRKTSYVRWTAKRPSVLPATD